MQYQHNGSLAGNSYSMYYGILLRSCAQKIWKSLYICKSYSDKIGGTFFMWTDTV